MFGDWSRVLEAYWILVVKSDPVYTVVALSDIVACDAWSFRLWGLTIIRSSMNVLIVNM